MSGKKGRSGRRGGIRSTIKCFEDTLDRKFPEILQAQIDKAIAGSTEAATLLFNYRLPKPKQEVALEVADAAEVALLYRRTLTTAQDEYKLLKEGAPSEEPPF